MQDRLERKKRFIHALAEYLGGTHQVIMSMGLDPKMEGTLSHQEALLWSKIRGETPLYGYPTVEEAEESLTEFLG